MRVIIIGGSGGIGAKIIQSLIDEHIYVVNVDLKPVGISSEYYTEILINLTSENIECTIADVLDKSPSIDGFISAIGYYGVNTLSGFTHDEYVKTMMINVEIPTLCAIQVANRMIAQNHGKMVFISSAAAFVGSRDIPYSISKSAIQGLVKGLSKSLEGINVYAYSIAPGIVETNMSKNMSASRKNDAVSRTINKRMCDPIEVAKLVRYILLEDDGYMNGATLHVNNGLYLN